MDNLQIILPSYLYDQILSDYQPAEIHEEEELINCIIPSIYDVLMLWCFYIYTISIIIIVLYYNINFIILILKTTIVFNSVKCSWVWFFNVSGVAGITLL
mgnify:CR=1 FL=1